MVNTATLYINDLRLSCIIGMLPWEQVVAQPLIIDLAYTFDPLTAVDDDITHINDYRAVVNAIQSFAAQRHFQLLETFTEQLATALEQQFLLSWLTLLVKKPAAIPDTAYVAVEITRGHRSGC